MDSLFILLQRLLPQHALSRLVGRLAAASGPRWLKNRVIRAFVRHYDVDLGEAERPFPEAYESFNAFFTRALKPGARPLCTSGIACPADGAISEIGDIDGRRILQAKGRSYSLEALLAGDEARVRQFTGGSFATIYLSPKDYHRVHMPLDGQLQASAYVPGDLFSVNGTTAAAIDGLFARNERHISYFDTPRGPMGMVLVGAMIVAGIETVWNGQVAPRLRQVERWDHAGTPMPVLLDRGSEMGRFLLGSTVILLFPKGVAAWNEDCVAGAAVRMGQQLSA
ncbi:archaetidylserine decarboxylase [Congregibacter litoralis]|uniref:Phosphatidylserine decarboxylase proenzyme n=1 Tax=Congregibacter litoralis KT71 TaxID=314285 RepID=A4A6L4_9GAMM|nr:archaetidylserine decarboxylase [Congregibacter litoralis]EAQ98661.2 phosphatidylserine decarboxylase precursor [Congregibacter litoralis KT71]